MTLGFALERREKLGIEDEVWGAAGWTDGRKVGWVVGWAGEQKGSQERISSFQRALGGESEEEVEG